MRNCMNKIYPKTISEYFGNGILVFFRRNFTCSEEFGIQKVGVGTTDVGLMEARVSKKSLVLAFSKIY